MVFIGGSGGVGKSYCIRMMQRDTIHLFRKYNLFRGEGGYEYNPEGVFGIMLKY